MSFSLLNIGMLAGLLGISIPILIHFLNRRRFDVVQWGAMQFLELGERTQQRIKLSDLLLLLVRIAMVALLAFAFSRPFLKGNTWIRSLHPEPVDLVIIIDGSYSMGWTGENITPHSRAIQIAHETLDDLTSVDRVAIIDARQRAHLLTSSLTDAPTARLELEKIEKPDGPANLVQAMTRACELLTQSYSTERDILVLTDKQKLSWALEDKKQWSEMLQVKKAAAVPITLSAIDVGTQQVSSTDNYLIGPLKASRNLLVANTPVTVTTHVKYTGQKEETTAEVFWSVDGQQLSRETETVKLRHGEQAVVQFTTRFQEPGSHLITASVDVDSLPGDDQSHVSLQVLDLIEAIVVTGKKPVKVPNQTPSRKSDFFLRLAFGDPDQEKVWVDSKLMSYDELPEHDLRHSRLLFLLVTEELASVSEEQFSKYWSKINEFLSLGGTLVFIPESSISEQSLEKIALQCQFEGVPVLPATFSAKTVISEGESGGQFDLDSFSANWLQRFRESKTTDLSEVLVSEYWKVEENEGQKAQKKSGVKISSVATDARLESGDPLFLRRFVGRGQILLSTISFDPSQSNLVRQRSFVPLLHELAMGLSETSSERNVELNQPLTLRGIPCQPLKVKVTGPIESPLYAHRKGVRSQVHWTLTPPKLSGIYTFHPGCMVLNHAKKQVPLEVPFSVNAPRDESNLDRLDDSLCEELEKSYQLKWRRGSSELLAEIANSSSGLEIWPVLLFIFLMLLVFELLLTKKLVQGGHHQLEPTD